MLSRPPSPRTHRIHLAGVLLSIALLLSAACASDSPSVSDGITVPEGATGPAGSGSPAHSIGVRDAGGRQELFDQRTGETFVPRGPNYLRMEELPGGGRRSMLFPPDGFDAETTRQDLAAMRGYGFNTVRVFFDHCRAPRPCTVGPDGSIDAAYLDNIAEFLGIAAEHDLQVILASSVFPAAYLERIPTDGPFESGHNSQYLTAEGVAATADYWRDLIAALQERDARLDSVLAYELTQEWYLDGELAPFVGVTGSVTTANGQTYNMTDAVDRQRIVEEGAIHVIAEVRRAIVEVDPTALFTAGFFIPRPPNPVTDGSAPPPGDPRTVFTARVIAESDLDFVDLHAYPGIGADLALFAERFGMTGDDVKPIIFGEFGGVTSRYSTAVEAAAVLIDFQVESCGLGIDGWVHWRWEDSVTDVYGSLVEGGAINEALAPINRPDPCVAG